MPMWIPSQEYTEEDARAPKVIEKVFNILKEEPSKEEYLVYLQAITQD